MHILSHSVLLLLSSSISNISFHELPTTNTPLTSPTQSHARPRDFYCAAAARLIRTPAAHCQGGGVFTFQQLSGSILNFKIYCVLLIRFYTPLDLMFGISYWQFPFLTLAWLLAPHLWRPTSFPSLIPY